MSERQAKRNKKIAETVGEVKVKKNKSSVLFNVIVTLLVLAVLGLAVYAVGTKYADKFAAQKAQEAATETTTVADFIAEKGISFDEFKTEYGIEDAEDVTEETDMNYVAGKLSLENYAKYSDMTLEDLKAQYGLGEDVAADTTWADAINFMTTGVVAQQMYGVDYETFKTSMGLPEEINENTPWSETVEIMNALMEQQQAEAAAEETAQPENESAGE